MSAQEDWFGEVPAWWQVRPLFATCRERKARNVGLREKNLLSLSYGNIVRKDIESNEGLLPASFDTYQIVEPGDVVLRLTDLQNDQRSLRSGSVRERGIITSAYVAVNPRSMDSRFAAYMFHAMDLRKVFYAIGGGVRQSMTFDDLRRLTLPEPPLAEQRAIADYLDRETAQIDEFIAENERFMELLTERRAAVIAHAVTKGLDPDVPLRDSGVEWLGEVPEGWDVAPIKYGYRLKLGKMLHEGRSSGEQTPYVRAGNIQDYGLDLSEVKTMSASASERVALALKSGDVVFVEGGGGFGRSDYVAEDLTGWIFQNHVIRLRARPGCDGRFIDYWLRFLRSLGHYEALSAFATIPNVSADKLGTVEMPVPPVDAQRAIADYLDESTARIDKAISTAREGIALAKERRSALISAAVTGKIDVTEGAA